MPVALTAATASRRRQWTQDLTRTPSHRRRFLLWRQRRLHRGAATPRYAANLASVDAELAGLLRRASSDADARREAARGPVLGAHRLAAPPTANWSSALDGDWRRRRAPSVDQIAPRREAAGAPAPTDVHAAPTRDSVRALMMIRAYRMRGHLARRARSARPARRAKHHEELDPATYGFTEADLDRQIFLDNVLGPGDTRRCARSSAILQQHLLRRRSASSSCTSPIPSRRRWIQERIEGPDKEISFTREGKTRDPRRS
ncbi:MAG: hypothetical protein MZV49_03610 [Rhodopseudomonas palustris]|nr:hypothetical protein [Rhodopseudomonas palustris]